MLAAIIQANSAVRSGPFVKVNVGALPKDLMEAELFGAEAGAFTGATKVRQGRFEAADGGTLFLDEIGNLSLEGQAKLLRVLQTGEFERLGSSVTRRVKVRVISATNADLPRRDRRRAFSRRPLLSSERHRAEGAAARRAQGRHPAARASFPGADGQKLELRGAARAARACLARQRSRADEHDPPRLVAVDRQRRSRRPISGFGRAAPHGEPRPSASPTGRKSNGRCRAPAGVIARAARELGLSRQALYRRMEKLGLKE